MALSYHRLMFFVVLFCVLVILGGGAYLLSKKFGIFTQKEGQVVDADGGVPLPTPVFPEQSTHVYNPLDPYPIKQGKIVKSTPLISGIVVDISREKELLLLDEINPENEAATGKKYLVVMTNNTAFFAATVRDDNQLDLKPAPLLSSTLKKNSRVAVLPREDITHPNESFEAAQILIFD